VYVTISNIFFELFLSENNSRKISIVFGVKLIYLFIEFGIIRDDDLTIPYKNEFKKIIISNTYLINKLKKGSSTLNCTFYHVKQIYFFIFIE